MISPAQCNNINVRSMDYELLNFGAEHCLTSLYFFLTLLLKEITFCWCRFMLPFSVVLLLSCGAVNHCGGLTFLSFMLYWQGIFHLLLSSSCLPFCALLSHEWVSIHTVLLLTSTWTFFLSFHIYYSIFPQWQGLRKEMTYCRLRIIVLSSSSRSVFWLLKMRTEFHTKKRQNIKCVSAKCITTACKLNWFF